MSRLFLLAVAPLGLVAAQSPAQTVQLPTFHQFSVSTTVLVPDRGGVLLGGARRSASGSHRFGGPGLRGNRAIGSAVDAGGMSVSARIHDLEAMDRALLDQAAAARGAARGGQESISRAGVRPSGGLHLPPQGGTSTIPPGLAEIRRRKAAEPRPTAEDPQALIDRAEEAWAEGRQGAARVYLQMAARRATGPLRSEALVKYDTWFKAPSNPR